MEAMTRDARSDNGPVFRAAELELRPAEFLVLAGGRPVGMTARELELRSDAVAGRLRRATHQPGPVVLRPNA